MKSTLVSGMIHMALAVALGAFGAHALQPKLTAAGTLSTYQTGNQYHFYHALGLLLLGWLMQNKALREAPPGLWSVRLIHIGIVLFSGSLYVLSVSQIKVLGAITPLGGVCFIAGWGLAAWACMKKL